MRFIFAMFMALMANTATAQEKQFTVNLTETQLNYIGKLLGKQPFEDVAALVNSVQAQVQAQLTREQALERDKVRDQVKKELQPPVPQEDNK